MTSKPNHGDGSHGDSASRPIHFFRIMLRDNLMQGKLRLPAKFVSRYGKQLSKTVFLDLPNGAEWKVNLEKRDGSVWFQEGWKEFVDFHSLAHGHLLVFKYDGTSHFRVLICDMSTMEIDYPVNKANPRRTRINSEDIQPRKTGKTNENDEQSNFNLPDTAFNKTVPHYKGKREIEGSPISNCGDHGAAGIVSFTVIMKPSYLNRTFLYLPKGPLNGYIKPGKQQYVTLLVGDRSWRVKLVHYQNKSESYFTSHWPVFARENDLKVGDACLFQLLNSSDDMVMKVSISRIIC